MSCAIPTAGESVRLSTSGLPESWGTFSHGLQAVFPQYEVNYNTTTQLYVLVNPISGARFPQTNVDCSTGPTIVTFSNGISSITPA